MERLNWGLIGGGEGSQIGPAHRIAAAIDGAFTFAAGALDANADAGRAYARRLGVADDRAYGNWRDMLDGERNRPDPVDLVTIATPNATHYEIAKAFSEAGFHVLVEKPMTMSVTEGEDLVRTVRAAGVLCVVNYGYSGYALVRHMRAMIRRGELGRVRLVKTEFAHGHHANAADAENPRVRWRYDPAQAGVSAVLADAGIHALHLARFATGQEVEQLSADFVSCVPGRALEDDAMLNLRFCGGVVGRLWTSAIALGRQHGLTIQVFGETGGLTWHQEKPDQLYWTPLSERTQIIERGGPNLSPEADRASRVAIGHAEGMPLAFANIYRDLADAIHARKGGSRNEAAEDILPNADAGLRSVAAVAAAARSAAQKGAWVDARPPMFSVTPA